MCGMQADQNCICPKQLYHDKAHVIILYVALGFHSICKMQSFNQLADNICRLNS